MQFKMSDKIMRVKPSAIGEILKHSSDPSVIAFSAGNPAPESFPVKAIKQIIDEIFVENPIGALQYSVTEGYAPLRKALAQLCEERYGIDMSQNEVILTAGAQQAIDLMCKITCNEGDAVISENPSFVGALNSFRAYNTELLGVEMDDDGINVRALENLLKAKPNARLMYLIPNFQNPSGKTMSWEKRKAVYELACKYDIVVIEDNPYGELRVSGEDVPAIKTIDTEGRVVFTGSFSKILSPGLRVGFIVMNKALVDKFTVAKQCSDVHTPILNQMICHKFITEHNFDEHIKNMQELYRRKCNLMLEHIKKNFSEKVKYTVPEGGLFIWCTLPEDVDMMSFCSRAVAEYKVAVVPGTVFDCDDNAVSQSFRMNFSAVSDEAIVKGCEILGKLTKELLD